MSEVDIVMNKVYDRIKKDVFTALGGHPIIRSEFENRLDLKADKKTVGEFIVYIKNNKVSKEEVSKLRDKLITEFTTMQELHKKRVSNDSSSLLKIYALDTSVYTSNNFCSYFRISKGVSS